MRKPRKVISVEWLPADHEAYCFTCEHFGTPHRVATHMRVKTLDNLVRQKTYFCDEHLKSAQRSAQEHSNELLSSNEEPKDSSEPTVLCDRCGKRYPHDPNHHGYPDVHQCQCQWTYSLRSFRNTTTNT